MKKQSIDIYKELSSGKTARFDEKLVHLLTCAARAFAEQGYEKTSIRYELGLLHNAQFGMWLKPLGSAWRGFITM